MWVLRAQLEAVDIDNQGYHFGALYVSQERVAKSSVLPGTLHQPRQVGHAHSALVGVGQHTQVGAQGSDCANRAGALHTSRD